MSDPDAVGAVTGAPPEERERLRGFGERLARAVGMPGQPAADAPSAPEPLAIDGGVPSPAAMRFSPALRGYDRGAVDRHIAELERELAALREQPAPPNALGDGIDKLAEETAAILRVAHEQAQAVTSRAEERAAAVTSVAEERADRCLGEARDEAQAITAAAEGQLRQLDVDTDAIWSERAALIDDMRKVSEALLALADDASRRFPPESQESSGRALDAMSPGDVPDADDVSVPGGGHPAQGNGVADIPE